MRANSLSCVTLTTILAAFVSASGLANAETSARRYLLPSDAGVVNVKDEPFGAAGDRRTDDTAAIRAAIKFAIEKHNRYSTPPFVFFPSGTYLVTDPLESKVDDHGWSGGWRAGMLLLGETRDGSVIKLADRAKGYTDADNPRAVIATGSESDKRTQPGDDPSHGGGNRAFRHLQSSVVLCTKSSWPNQPRPRPHALPAYSSGSGCHHFDEAFRAGIRRFPEPNETARACRPHVR